MHSFKMLPATAIKSLLLFALVFLLSLTSLVDSSNDTDETGLSSTYSSIRIGVVLDLDSPMGAMLDLCLSMAHSDFYSVHSNYQTRLSLHRKNAKGQFGVGSAGGTSSFSLNFELLPAVESFRLIKDFLLSLLKDVACSPFVSFPPVRWEVTDSSYSDPQKTN